MRFRSIACALALLAASAPAQSVLATFNSDSPTDVYGRCVGRAGDTNNDGKSDLLIGNPDALVGGVAKGRVFLVSGAGGSTLWIASGSNANDQFGTALTGIGDVDQDGSPDVAIGAPRTATGQPGYVRILSGATGTPLFDIVGNVANDRFGFALAAIGDATGDGLPEIAIGAPGAFQALLVNGATGIPIHLTNAGGSAVSGVGDVDHDGVPDFIVGFPSSGGSVGMATVFSGRTGGFLLSVIGAAALDQLGNSVAGGADLNLDGTPDFLVGAPDDTNWDPKSTNNPHGYVRAYSGTGSLLYTVSIGGPGAQFGWALALVGDVNGDGISEFATGEGAGLHASLHSGANGSQIWTSPPAEYDGRILGVSPALDYDQNGKLDVLLGYQPLYGIPITGAAKVVSGSNGTSLLRFTKGLGHFGQAVANAKDLDGDGVDDLLVGGPTDAQNGTSAGALRAISGATGSVLYDRLGDEPQNALGFSLASIGDVDADGVADFVSGAPGNGGIPFYLGNIPGFARVYSGASGSVITTAVGSSPPPAHDLFGFSVSGVGDLNGDGIPDWIVGAPDGNNSGGVVETRSGATGAVFATFTGTGDLGYSVAGLGDVTGDGVPDFVMTDPRYSNSGPKQAIVISGATNAILFVESPSPNGYEVFGKECSFAGDVDRDGVGDFLVSSEIYPGDPSAIAARVFSGRNGSVLWAFTGTTASGTGVGDVDLDGHADFAISSIDEGTDLGGFQFIGVVRVRSGKTGAVLETFTGDSEVHPLGYALAGRGDWNGDGFLDLAAGAPYGERVRTLSLVFQGVAPFGAGTPGCLGPHEVGASGSPAIGNLGFEVRSAQAPASSLGLGLVTDAPDFFGNDLFGLGVTLHEDFLAAVEVYALDATSDVLGFGHAPAPIPNFPPLVGKQYAAQFLWLWPPSQCTPSPFGLSTSPGILLTILP